METLMPLLLLMPVLSFSSQAFAHVTLEPKSADAGAYAKLVFLVPHGCEGSPTISITVQIPEGAFSVKPQVHPGWRITTKSRKLAKPILLHGKDIVESISEVTWTGGPLPDEYMDEFGMSAKLPDSPTGRLYFPVIQECKKGLTHWSEIPDAKSGEHPKTPAPAVELRVSSGAGHSH